METKQKRRQVMNYIMKGKESLNPRYDVGVSTDTVGGETDLKMETLTLT